MAGDRPGTGRPVRAQALEGVTLAGTAAGTGCERSGDRLPAPPALMAMIAGVSS